MSEARGTDRYGAALFLLIVSILVFAVADHTAVGRAALLGTKGIAVVVVLHASGIGVRGQRIATAVIAAAVVGGSSGALLGGEATLWAPAVISALLLFVAPVAIVRRLVNHARIDHTTVLGALCLYLLVGMFFAYVYLAIGDVTGHRFFEQVPTARQVDYVYFSFATLATLGYGDLTPTTDLGRMLSVTESVIGQLYLVGAVAAIVSNLGMVRTRRSPPG